MIYGIVAERRITVPGGGAGYSPQGVHFSGSDGSNGMCGFKLSSLTCTNNGFLSWAGWFKLAWYPTSGSVEYPFAWMCDSAGNYIPTFKRTGTSQWEWDIGNDSHSWGIPIGLSNSDAFLTNNTWQHVIASCDVNQASGSKKFKIYVDDVDATGSTTESQPASTLVMNGFDFWLGDDGYGDGINGDIADFSFWPGISFLTAGDIAEATRRLFIDSGGRPVDPSVAIASLGTPAIMCSGGVSGFLANSLGGSGSLTVPGGYDLPTNSSTSP